MQQDIELFYQPGSGTGACLMMLPYCGIGDDIAALPAIFELAHKTTVTIYTEHVEYWRSFDAFEVIGVHQERCDNGEVLDPYWDATYGSRFAGIYKLGSWGVWEDREDAELSQPRMTQMAELLGVDILPFDYRAALLPDTIPGAPYLLLSTESHSSWRSLPPLKEIELLNALTALGNVVWLKMAPSSRRERTVCQTWRELLNLIWNAKQIIGIDNGIAHIAAALQKPIMIIGGVTDIRSIFKQYDAPLTVIQTNGPDCIAPCYMRPDRNFKNHLCCGQYSAPQCMNSIVPSELI